jgi:hypothetical protein
MNGFVFRSSYWVVFFTFIIQFVYGQNFNFLQKIDPFPVLDQTNTPLPFPFLGGYNTPRPQFIDIDEDGDLDLFMQENKSELMFFENVGSNTNQQFKWKTNSYQNIDIDDWFRFVDIDGDLDFDLLVARPISLMKYFRNDGSSTSPNFILTADTLKDINNSVIPAEIGSIPVLCDIDADDDPDLFIGRQNGRVTYFKNMGLDTNNLPRFEFVSDTFQNILIIGGTRSNTLHGANALEFVDINNNLTFDLFWGDFFSPSLYFLENIGTPQSPNLELIYDEYPPLNPLLNGGWNIPRFADIDADNDVDLFVGEVGGAFSTTTNQIENFYFYENTGSPQNPAFNQRSTQFIKSLDIGKKSIPAMVDIDDDGDLDLFMAAEVDPGDSNFSSLHFYENVGIADSAIYKLIEPDYLNLNFGFSYSPTFTDIDADGDQDLFIGKFFGQIYFLKNTGTASSPDFPTVIQNFSDIDVGNNATLAFVDIDADHDNDLFIGESDGTINFYQNEGDSSVADFTLIDENYFGIDVGENSFPFLVDIDGDLDFDLIIGSQSDGIKLYRNEGNQQNPNFIEDTDFYLSAPLNCTPILMDIDNDTDLDIFSGALGGGLVFYENLQVVSAVNPKGKNILPTKTRLMQNYPNPFNPTTTISFILSKPSEVRLSIYNTLGQTVKILIDQQLPMGDYNFSWDGTDEISNSVSSGIYIYQLTTEDMVELRKMILLR